MYSYWSHARPTKPGTYKLRDPIFGWKAYVIVYYHPVTGMLYTRPEDEDETHGVPIDLIAHWWQWRLLTREEAIRHPTGR